MAVWFKANFQDYCISSQTQTIVKAYQTLVQHVNASTIYNQKAKDEFMQVTNADAWLLAHCVAAQNGGNSVCLITAEVFSQQSKKRVPIPNICKDFNVDYCNCFDLLRTLGFSF